MSKNININLNLENNEEFKSKIKEECEEYNFIFTEDDFIDLCKDINVTLDSMINDTVLEDYFEEE
jgi:hypothetical protein